MSDKALDKIKLCLQKIDSQLTISVSQEISLIQKILLTLCVFKFSVISLRAKSQSITQYASYKQGGSWLSVNNSFHFYTLMIVSYDFRVLPQKVHANERERKKHRIFYTLVLHSDVF
jgi:hypothetical protein